MRIEMMACIAALDFGCRKSWQVPYVRAFWQSALKLGNDVCIIWLVAERRLVLKRHRPHLPERRFDNPCLSHDYRSSSHFKPYVRPNVTPCAESTPVGEPTTRCWRLWLNCGRSATKRHRRTQPGKRVSR